MEREELIQLIEGPILKAYSGKRRQPESDNTIISSNSNNGNDDNLIVSSDKSSKSDTKQDVKSSGTRQVQLSEAQRDRRTVFVQQLSVRCTDQTLLDFFTSNSCPVRNARIVIDKYTRKSKGVAYVEFYEEETVRVALKLSGQKVLGVPMIVELTETEKNRIAQEAAACNNANMSTSSTSSTSSALKPPVDGLVRLYVGSLHPSLTESELGQLFEPFGELESVELLKDERSGTSKGVAFVQYKRVGAARRALESLNGFELAGRAIRVGPVRVDPSKLKGTEREREQVKESKELASGKGVEVDEEENITLDAKKRAELMQKLLSSRK